MSFTRIGPEDNSIIFYPRAAFHEATTVHCPSADFGDSRFAIIGHIQGQAMEDVADSGARPGDSGVAS